MLAVADLTSFGAPSELVEAWGKYVNELTDVQEKAVRAGALDGHSNLLLVAPTSSGKTFVGELAAATSAYTRRQHSIFIVPFRALADEHYDLFRQRYAGLLSVVISTSDWAEFDADIRAGNFNLAVMTYEKLMSFLAQQPGLLGQCTTVVVDEVQSLSDAERGAKLEILLTQILLAEDPPQIIALSASVDEINRLDSWLKATLVSSAERPVPLTESVCAPSGSASMMGADGKVYATSLASPQGDRDALLVALTERFVSDGKQVIVFRTTIPRVLEAASLVRARLPAVGLSQDVGERLDALDDSDSLNDLRLLLASRIGFHNGDMTHPERSVVEDAFRSGEARVLVATTTLSMGVNLPSDVVIIADSTRPRLDRGGWRFDNISVSEYRNAAGRAGRLGKRTAGLAVLLAEDSVDQRQLLNAYLFGHVEPVISQIPRRPLADVIFSLICADVADSEEALANFIASTFAYLTFYEQAGGGLEPVVSAVADAVTRCVDSGLVVKDSGKLYPTETARVFGAAGLSLASAIRLASALELAVTNQLSRQDIIFEVASCPEVGDRPWLRRGYGGGLQDPRPHHVPDSSGSSPSSRLNAVIAKRVVPADEGRALVRARCLLEWMSGKNLRLITTEFRGMGAAASRVRDLGKYGAWILDTLAQAAQARAAPSELTSSIQTLALEARYGLPAPLAPLARLQVTGVWREHLLRLYTQGDDRHLYDPETFLDASDDAFEGLLTPLQVANLRHAILADFEESIRRKRAGHVARADQVSLPRQVIDDLYSATGAALEQAVADALTHAGLSATRILHQPQAEEDVRVTHADGTIVISVTARQQDARPVRWTKAREILGTGAGLNPINYVCIGRPGFESLAVRQAADIARESGTRSILLMPMPILAEAILRIAEGGLEIEHFGALLAHQRGLLTTEDFTKTTTVSEQAS